MLSQLDVEELEELGSLALHTAQKKGDYSEKFSNTTPTGSKRLNLEETPKLPTQSKLASMDISFFDSSQARENLSIHETQNWNKEVVQRDFLSL